MILKISNEFDGKLKYVSQARGIKKTVLIEKIFEGFFTRYEKKFGRKVEPVKHGKKANASWLMYGVYKKYYLQIHNKEYSPDQKAQKVDLQAIRTTKEKILKAVIESEKLDLIAIDDQDFVNSYEFILSKMPKWWKENMFTPQGISRNFDKILIQIQNGKQSGRDALDDFIQGLG
jgi:hypothetical protein